MYREYSNVLVSHSGTQKHFRFVRLYFSFSEASKVEFVRSNHYSLNERFVHFLLLNFPFDIYTFIIFIYLDSNVIVLFSKRIEVFIHCNIIIISGRSKIHQSRGCTFQQTSYVDVFIL